MSKQTIKISVAYLFFAIIYYSISFVVFSTKNQSGKNLLEKLLIVLGDIFFWISVNLYFAIIVFTSTIIGMIFCRTKGYTEAFVTFRNICILVVAAVTILVILSNL